MPTKKQWHSAWTSNRLERCEYCDEHDYPHEWESICEDTPELERMLLASALMDWSGANEANKQVESMSIADIETQTAVI